MKVFLTGCTASHASTYSNEKTPSFAGIINMALTELGCEVVWDSPSVTFDKEYLSQFDSVIVGVSSPTNVTSHRIYGALSVIKHASELGNLSLFVDTPDPHKIYAGLREIYLNPQSLVKPFYSKKREYNQALEKENYANIFSGLTKLFTEAWPKTIIPAYPWSKPEVISKYIPTIDNNKLFLVAPDSVLLEIQRYRTKLVDGDYWCSDSQKSKWALRTFENITKPVVNYRQSKWEANEDILERLDNSIGALISVYKDGNPWWLPSLSQALFVGVPVATDWRQTVHLGSEWSILPAAIEELTPEKRLELARRQKELYTETLPSWSKVKENLGNVLLQKTYTN